MQSGNHQENPPPHVLLEQLVKLDWIAHWGKTKIQVHKWDVTDSVIAFQTQMKSCSNLVDNVFKPSLWQTFLTDDAMRLLINDEFT